MSLVQSRSAPVLVCLNLQRAYIDPADPCFAPRADTALIHAGACLAWARRQNLSVWHVQTSGDGPRFAPIPGFEPNPSEPVLRKRASSLFDSTDLARARPPLRYAIVLGFTAARDCLASAVDAERSGAQLVFVSDAIASSALTHHAPELVDSVLTALLGEWAVMVTTAELLRREPRLVPEFGGELEHH